MPSERATIDAIPESERLARRFFAAHEQGGPKAGLELFHPEIEMVLKTRYPGDVLRGKDAVAGFIDEIEGSLYELVAEVYRPLDDNRIVVEGRIRWADDERVLRDDPVIWALEFRDGLVWRSAPASSTIQAETILEASRNADS
ncbi:MAG: nuclear transport factor 2 family protein [Gaiellaceae bacterium]